MLSTAAADATAATSSSTPSLERTFRGHRGPVTAASFHPNLQQIASSSNDGCVMLWNVKPTMRAFRFVGHRGPVNAIDFSHRGNLVISGSADTTVRVWIPTVKGECAIFNAHSAPVRCLAISADDHQLITGSNDKSVKLWNLRTHTFEKMIGMHNNWVRSVAMNSSLCVLAASGGDDKVVRIWDINSNGPAVQSLYDCTDSVTALAFHPDGNSLAAGSADCSINLWDLRMNRLLQRYGWALPGQENTMAVHTEPVTSVSFHPSGSWLLSSSMDASAKLWDLKEGCLYCTLNAHHGPILGARFSPCGRQLVTCGQDGLVMVWNAGIEKGPLSPVQASTSREASRPSLAPAVDSKQISPVQHPHVTPRSLSAQGRNAAHQDPVATSAAQRSSSADRRRAATPQPPPSGLSVTGQRPVENVRDVNVAAELPVEQIIRQVDITAQTQSILETRMSHSEAAVRSIQDNVRERDARLTQQIEILMRQVSTVTNDQSEQRKEMERLKCAIAAQTEMIKQLLEAKKN